MFRFEYGTSPDEGANLFVTPHPPLKRSPFPLWGRLISHSFPFCRRQYLHVVQHHCDQRELHHWTKSISLRSTSLDEVHIIAKHIIECMCESLRNTSSTTKGGPPVSLRLGHLTALEHLVPFTTVRPLRYLPEGGFINW